MFIEDGTNIDYNTKKSLDKRYSWGWLGGEVLKYGWEDLDLKKKVIDRLKTLKACMYHMGHYTCQICLNVRRSPEPDIKTFNGSYLIEYQGLELRCPAGVEHYIEQHDYNPGSFVIDAVLNGTNISIFG